jgi:hypothetical protein
MKKYDPIGFSRNLVKGRIAETIFEQMHRDARCYTILAFGYENILPELASRQHDTHTNETMEIIRRAPDFAVIDHETHEVRLIEVKYLKNPIPGYILADAKRMHESWKPSYLFLATPKGFFMDSVSSIVEKNGRISPLGFEKMSEKLQAKYTALLNEFER